MIDRDEKIMHIVKLVGYLIDTQKSKFIVKKPKSVLFLMYLVDIEQTTGKTCYASDLCKLFAVKSSQATNIIKEMEDKGWIKLSKSETDGRKHQIIMLEEGYKAARVWHDKIKDDIKANFECVTDEELKVLNDVIEKMSISVIKEAKNQ
jgi:DNA-binding MarR family transcriptional regulator